MTAATEVVNVEGGEIAGVIDRGVRVFKGIPYAAPPVGALRWKPPQPVTPWKRHARRVGLRRRMSADAVRSRLRLHPPAAAAERRLPLPQRVDTARRGRQAAGVRLDPRRRADQGLGHQRRARRRAARTQGCRARLAELPARRARLSGASGADGGVAAASRRATTACSIRSRRCSGCRRNIARVWRRSIARHHRRRVGRLVEREHAGGVAAGQGPVHPRHRTKRRPLQPHAASHATIAVRSSPPRTSDWRSRRASRRHSLAALRAVPADTIAARTVRTQENVDGWVLPDEIRTIFASKKHNRVAGHRRLERRRDDVAWRRRRTRRPPGRLPKADGAAVRRARRGVRNRLSA